jgi:threonine synthase
LFQDDFETLAKTLSSYSFTDAETKAAMLKIFKNDGYTPDPHGAVGYLGLKKYQESHLETYGIFLETAHPVKFLDVVEEVIGESPEIPMQIQKVMDKEKKSVLIATYGELKSYLLEAD